MYEISDTLFCKILDEKIVFFLRHTRETRVYDLMQIHRLFTAYYSSDFLTLQALRITTSSIGSMNR